MGGRLQAKIENKATNRGSKRQPMRRLVISKRERWTTGGRVTASPNGKKGCHREQCQRSPGGDGDGGRTMVAKTKSGGNWSGVKKGGRTISVTRRIAGGAMKKICETGRVRLEIRNGDEGPEKGLRKLGGRGKRIFRTGGTGHGHTREREKKGPQKTQIERVT